MYIYVCTVEPSYVEINGSVHILWYGTKVLSVYNVEALQDMISFHA